MNTGAVAAMVTFAVLLLSNMTALTMDFIPFGDASADILLTQRAKKGWLLTGHYSFVGVHHPGPFFLYFRLLGQWLAGDFTGSVFGSQLMGVLLFNSLSAGLLAYFLKKIAELEGGKTSTANLAASCVLAVVLCVLNSFIASFWMPDILIATFLTFLLAATLACQGNTFGFIVATLYSAILAHGYIPMPIIVGPIWIYIAVTGQRLRNLEIQNGFPLMAWMCASLIFLLFGLPMVVDCFYEPPGNVFRIVQVSQALRKVVPAIQFNTQIEIHNCLTSLGGRLVMLTIFSILSAPIVYKTMGRYKAIWGVSVRLIFITIIASIVAFSQAATPLHSYMLRFLVACLILPVAIGILVTILESTPRQRQTLIFLAVVMALIFALKGKFSTLESSKNVIRDISTAISEEIQPGSLIEFTGEIKDRANVPGIAQPGMVGWTVAGLMLDLDRFGISSCFSDPRLSYVLTPERICSGSSNAEKKYEIREISPCNFDVGSVSGKSIGLGMNFSSIQKGKCLRIAPTTN